MLQMQRYNLTKEQAEEKIKKIINNQKSGYTNMSEFDFKSMSPKNKEHWIKKRI
jgi:hypothetical protein